MTVEFVRSEEVQAYVESCGVSLGIAADLRWGFTSAWTFQSSRVSALTIPHYAGGVLVGVKARTISGDKKFSQMPGSKIDGLYAAQLLDPTSDEVSLFEGPEDCALAMSHGFNATAINAAGAKISDEEIARLAAYKRVFLIGDQDEAGRRAVDALKSRLPPEQVIRVRIPGFKDIGEMYEANPARFAANLANALIGTWLK